MNTKKEERFLTINLIFNRDDKSLYRALVGYRRYHNFRMRYGNASKISTAKAFP